MSILEDKTGIVPPHMQKRLNELHSLEVACEDCDCESGMSPDAYEILAEMAPSYDMVLPPAPEGDGLGMKQIALESIRSTLKQWWEQLKAWVIKMRRTIMSWVRTTLQGIDGLVKHADTLRKSVEANSNFGGSDVEIKHANLLAIDGQPVNDLARQLEELRKINEVGMERFTKQGQTSARDLTNDLTKLDFRQASKAVEGYVDAFPIICKTKVNPNVSEDLFGMDPREVDELRMSDTFLGNYCFVSVKAKRDTHYTNSEIENLQAVVDYAKRSKIRFYQDGNKETYEGSLPSVDQRTAVSIIDAAVNLAKSVKASNGQRQAEERLENEFLKKADAAAKVYLEEDADAAQARAVRSLFSVVLTMINGLGFHFSDYLISTAKSSLAYVNELNNAEA